MTDAQKMLALARAVYPNAFENTDDLRPDYRGVFIPKGHDNVKFDPANNSDQAWEVLAGLLKYSEDAGVLLGIFSRHRFFIVAGDHVAFCETSYEAPETLWKIKHDGTAPGLRAAVLAAALRVAD